MKVSVIMQSYLGEYPGSRSNPVFKFHRAINSFLNQTYKNAELIIVSDGCDITHSEYFSNYKDNDLIKYAYIDKSNRMYEKSNNTTYYRGLPRQIGIEIATGEIICYFDTDDFLMPNHLETIISMWNIVYDSCDWIVNTAWFDNQYRMYNPFGSPKGEERYKTPLESDLREIEGLPDLWYPTVLVDTSVSSETATVSHKRSCITKWKDTVNEFEDHTFFKKLFEDYPNASKYQIPTYVRCHFPNKWDF